MRGACVVYCGFEVSGVRRQIRRLRYGRIRIVVYRFP